MSIDNNKMEKLPKTPNSYWIKSTDIPSYPQLEQDLKVDVVIVGGGITGVTTAYLLIKEGYRVALLEGSKMLNGTTGHTTAKITAQHDLIYDELITHFGEEKAALYYQANHNASGTIQELIKLHGINCDYRHEDAYVYTNDEQYVQKIKQEAEAYEKLGIAGGFIEQLPLDLQIKAAVVMKRQAQFHPLHYLASLLTYIEENGGEIYENTIATKMEQGNPATVHIRNGVKVVANYVISASHFPFHDGQAYFARLYPKRSYIVAGKPSKVFNGGMYINVEKPTRSIRSVTIDGEEMLLFVGEGHKTGQGKPEMEHYDALEKFAKDEFGTKEIVYRWSAQDLVTPDKVPYIGKISNDYHNVFIATGYRKWGMTTGTLAAEIIRDLMIGKPNPYEELFSPSRFNANPSIKKMIKENMNVAAHLISGKLDRPDKEIKDVQNGEGSVISIKGKRAGAYKTEEGELFVVDTTCTHMGCELNWNGGDRTWDCPCHGSRFSYEGEVVEGPAEKSLKRIDPDSINYFTS